MLKQGEIDKINNDYITLNEPNNCTRMIICHLGGRKDAVFSAEGIANIHPQSLEDVKGVFEMLKKFNLGTKSTMLQGINSKFDIFAIHCDELYKLWDGNNHLRFERQYKKYMIDVNKQNAESQLNEHNEATYA